MAYQHTVGQHVYAFADLKILLAKATPLRAGDVLAGVAAATYPERVAAQYALADVPLRTFLHEALVPYEQDEVTRLIIDTHDAAAFAPVAHFTVGELRDWLVSDAADGPALAALAPGLTPEMVAAVSKLLRNQELIAVARRVEVITRFRNTLGLRGHLATRLQPNHPTDDLRGIAASLVDGLLYGSGDAVLGINPATDSPHTTAALLHMLDAVREQYAIPTQTCVLCHVTTTLELIKQKAPVDLTFQSIGGTEATNKSFGISLSLLQEAHEATLSLKRGTVGQDVMYFETGQGSALSANAHHGLDQQTCEARAYAVARRFRPLLVNTVVGFIGPEYLYDGKQIIRAALEDHFCGKLLGLPMGVDVCYTNHAEADQDDMDTLLTVLGVAGCSYIMGVPGADDILLGYQSTSFHDALYLRRVLGLRPAPEFAAWLVQQGIFDEAGRQLPPSAVAGRLGALPLGLGWGATPDEVFATSNGVFMSYSSDLPPDPWAGLTAFTAARIALGRTGTSEPLAAALAFRLAHAQAREAVYSELEADRLLNELAALSLPACRVSSQSTTRPEYLQRPDLGRRLNDASAAALAGLAAGECDLVFVLADGLSATATNTHAVPLLRLLLPELAAAGLRLGPVVLAGQARVALGDEVGSLLKARLVLVLLGERPGLSAPDSLGAYFTYAPHPGLTDEARNCVSNIRPAGLPYAAAAARLAWLLGESLRRQLSGVALKDETAAAGLGAAAGAPGIAS